MNNVVFISCLIILCACSTVGVAPEEFSDRMSITMTLLLTSVAFKLVTTEWVPRIAYQTLLDKYNLLTIVVLMAIVLENLIVALLIDEEWFSYEKLESNDEVCV